ncbi:MAG TPA: carboxymuconolactone decarboxylase family protein [Acetobacteraceae bacterium]|nr:carboxymuconolactone decarboxylase family protein [Acetobacteraceae bacterium]
MFHHYLTAPPRDWTRTRHWCAISANDDPEPTQEETMAKAPSTASRDRVRGTVPKLIDLSEKVLFGDVWERPQLSKRDRSLIVCATLIATYRPEQLRGHLERALINGVTKEELSEVITHLAFYAGWPAAMSAANIAREVFEANP